MATLGWRQMATVGDTSATLWRHFGDTWRRLATLGDAWRHLATPGGILSIFGPFGDAPKHFDDTSATLWRHLATLWRHFATHWRRRPPVFQSRGFGRCTIFQSIDCGRRLLAAPLMRTESVRRFRAALASRCVRRHACIRPYNATRLGTVDHPLSLYN